MEKKNDITTLQDLNVSIQTWHEIKLDKTYLIPLYIHIKDISDYKENIIEYKVDIMNDDHKLNLISNPFKRELLQYKMKQDMDYYFRFIDKRKLYEGKSFEENLGVSIYDLFNEGTIQGFINEIEYYINKVKFMFLTKATLLFDFDRKFPQHYKPKDSGMSQDVKENVIYPVGMTMVQGEIEYPSNIIFDENIGVAVIKHSFREVQLKAMYIHMKNKIEGFLNSYQAWKSEQDRPKS